MHNTPLTRRKKLSGLGLAGIAGGGLLARQAIAATNSEAERVEQRRLQAQNHEPGQQPHTPGTGTSTDPQDPHRDLHGSLFVVGEVDHAANGFNPTDMLTGFDYGAVSTLPSGQTLREYTIVSTNKTIEVAPGVSFSAWVYNGRCPGPFIRATEGDRVRITFINGSDHPHSMHFHGIHEANMDGVLPVKVGETFVYEFDAAPFGLHLYHCHVPPFMRHLHKGLYGLFIVDPKTPRPPAKEMAMVMNACDVNFDGATKSTRSIPLAFTTPSTPSRSRSASWPASTSPTSPSSTRSTRFTCTPSSSTTTTPAPRLPHRRTPMSSCNARPSAASSSLSTTGPASSCSTPTKANLTNWGGWGCSR